MAELSTNPFRRKGTMPAVEAPAIPQAASPAAFLESITTAVSTPDSEDPRDGRPTKTKTKVVKRVRVQSPPPLSPDSPVKTRYQGDDSSDDDDLPVPGYGHGHSSGPEPNPNPDPFEQRFPANPDHFALAAMPEAAPLVAANQGLANPFGTRTNLDPAEIEQDRDAATTAAPPGKGAMDVNAFSRLLLTGQSGRDNSTETSSISKHSISDGQYDAPSPAPAVEVTPRTSHEATDQEREDGNHAAEQTPVQKKAPPPPSSRRGKAIKPPPREDGPFASPPTPRSPSDMNKPLPPAPRAHDTDDEVEDIFAREAAGKTPETHDAVRAPEPGSGKKPTPVPPPRRGHSRSESKLAGNTHPPTSHDDEAQPRSSLESQHSRLESVGGRQAPAPPPPRRPGVSQRLSAHFGSALTSPTSPSISEAEIMGFSTEHPNASVDTVGDDHPKIAPPPPPPARNLSTRRPNPRTAEGARRSLGSREKENAMAPPPPPPRQRGSSKGSMDGPGPVGRGSLDSVRVFTPPGPQGGIAEEQAAAEEGRGDDILADLDALQREVDALRGKFGP
ncbi:hypothetical protein F5X68DRAFT_216805 [Plectosphaerella plurivora]|uniref:Uncharacterized protein n=1 Tax=Plectosphaerella plurivora TaxID=936078 RepID=A0A9P9A620_9PEZI|nr:hypothetical protein F5X68DRAFT_216805 [Plectosphaerella plurivora]